MVQHKNPCRPGRRKQGFLQHGMKAYVTGHASSHIRAPRQTQHLDELTTRHDTWVTHHADGRSPGLCRARYACPIWVWAAGNITPLPRRIARWCVKPAQGGFHRVMVSRTYSCGGSDGLAVWAAHRSSLFIPCGTPSAEHWPQIASFFKTQTTPCNTGHAVTYTTQCLVPYYCHLPT